MKAGAGVKAVLFDVDGTLYRQRLLRAAMAAELAAGGLMPHEWRTRIVTLRVLREYRRAHEVLRRLGPLEVSLARTQVAWTADRTGMPPAVIDAIVDEWMVRRPLKYLRWCCRPGIEELLQRLNAAGYHVGVLSDYPVSKKLDALGLASSFSLTLCTSDRDVNAFKPHPRGFLRACELWGLRPEEVLYVGDRPDVDGEGARAAGLPCVILTGTGRRHADPRGWLPVRGLAELGNQLISGSG